MTSIVIILICLFFSSTRLCEASNSSTHVIYEEQLRNDLFASFDTRVRPNTTSEIYIEFVLMALNDLRIEEQEMSVMVLFHTTWYDERLKWDPLLYDGLTGIVVDKSEMWSPNLIVQNTVSSIKSLGKINIPLRVWHTGRVMWAPPVHLDTSCEMQVLFFPFEVQQCTIILYPYGYLAHEIQLKIRTDGKPVNLLYYGENAAWQFVSASSGNTSLVDDREVYPALTYTLTFKRRWLFMALSLILPSILNLILMLGVFTLHIESGEKMGYSLTVLLSYIVLMTLVGDMLPQVSTQISLLQIYLAFVLVVGCLSTLMTIWIINIYNRDDDKNPIPMATKNILKWIILPVTTMLFWSFFVWRFIKRHNKVVDDKQEKMTESDKPYLDGNCPSSTPPMSTYTPCSLRQVQVNDTQQMLMTHGIKYENLPSLPPPDGHLSDTSSIAASKSGDMQSVYSTTDSVRELTLYSSSNSLISPPPPISPQDVAAYNSKKARHEIDDLLDKMTWKDVALLLDSFCLRSLGGILLVFTFVMLVMLFLQY